MSWKGNLIKAGISSDGHNVELFKGNLTLNLDYKLYFRDTGIYLYSNADGYLTIVADTGIILDGAVSFTGDFTLGDAITDSLIVNGRIATGSEAGSALSIDATTFQYTEGMEMRYAVTDWDDVYTLTEFRGMYLRAENQESQAASIYGAVIYGVTNAVNLTNIWGALFYGYVKGSAAVTVSRVYGIQTEVTWDAGGSQDTLSVEATPILAKVTSGPVNDYTKIHGMIIRMGDMDGGSRTYGSGIWIEDDPDMSGTSVFTTGIDIELACTTGIKMQGAMTDGIIMSGAMTDGMEIQAATDSAIRITGSPAYGINMGAATTGISLAGAMTDGILISGACGDNGIEITGTCTTAGVKLGTTNKLMFHDAGMYIRASADGHLEIVSDDTITLSSPGHGGIVFGGETDWGTGAAGYDIDGNGWDWATQTVAHVDSGALAAACAAAYHALTVTPASHTTGSSFFGTWTELYLQATQDFANANNCAAVWGQIEGGAAITTSDVSDCFTAGGYFNVIMGATFTNHTDHVVNGVRAQLEVATSGLTNNGRMAAFECLKKSGTQDWDYGLYIADSVQAINATITMVGGAALDGIKLTVTDNIAIASTSYSRGIYVNYTNAGIKSANAEVNGIGSDINTSADVTSMYAASLYTGACATATVNRVAGMYVYIDDVTGTVGATSCLHLETASDGAGTRDDFISIRAHVAGVHAIISDVSGGATATYLLELLGAGVPSAPCEAFNAAGNGAYSIKCRINGVDTYLHTYDAP